MAMSDFPTGTVTFLYADIEGSTDIRAELGDDWDDVVRRHAEVFRDAIRSARTTEPQAEGDAFFVVFASAEDAVGCAANVQRRFAEQRWPGGVDVRVRIGLHTGEAQIEHGEYVGVEVRRTERIARSGHGGQIVMSATTAALNERTLPPLLRMRDHGRHELKDLAYPEHLYQLVVDGLPEDFPPLRTLSSRKSNLPDRDRTFVGRADEIDRLAETVLEHRLVSVVGAAGVGKSALVREAAARLIGSFADGVWMVEAFRATDERLLAGVVAKELNIAESGPQPLTEQVVARLQRADTLLILDGCEHLVGGVGGFVQTLLDAAPHVRVLTTSREALAAADEHVFALSPLAIPPAATRSPDAIAGYDAVALFADRAREVDPGFVLDAQTAATVAEICRKLDGLPLAIELAAARLSSTALADVADRIDRTAPSARTSRAAGDQLTLEETLAWSFETLGPEERTLFARLSVFVGGFSRDAAAEVCGSEPLSGAAVEALVDRLVDTSLLVVTPGPSERYRFLEPIANYARSRLAQGEGLDDLQRRHAAYYLHLAEEADPHLRGPEQTHWAAVLEADRYNMRAALRWARVLDPETSLRLAGALRWFWVIRRDLTEGMVSLRNALANRGGASPIAIARALNGVALLSFRALDFDTAEQATRQSLEIYEQQGHRVGIARAMYHLGVLHWFRDEHRAADEVFERAQELAEEVGDRWYLAWTLALRGTIARTADDFERAAHFLERGHELFQEVGGTIDRGWSFLRLGALARDLGHYEEAAEHYSAGRVLLSDHGDDVGLAHSDAALGAIEWMKGNRDQALSRYRRVLATFGAVDEGANNLFELKMMIQGDPTVKQLEQVAEWNKERSQMEGDLGIAAALAEFLYHLGKTACRQGHFARARAAFRESLGLCRDAGDFRGAAVSLIGLGRSLAGEGDHERALMLYGAAAGVAEADALDPWPPVNEPTFENAVAAARVELGEDAAGLWGKGRAMGLDEAVAVGRA